MSRYRAWLQDYFANEFNYESTLYMSLNKVREFIMNEQSSIGNPKMRNNPGTGNMPREYDLVVKVEKTFSKTPFDVMRVMTGGKQPEIRFQTDSSGKEHKI